MLKTLARNVIFPFITTLGLEKTLFSRFPNNMLNVYYHGVVRQNSSNIFPRHIQKEQFEEHLKYFKNHFNVISLKQAFELYRSGTKVDHRTITISFDDGYLNNLKEALPLLEKYKLHSTFFISGICIENPNYLLWADVVSFCRFLSKQKVLIIDGISFKKVNRFGLYNKNKHVYASDYLKQLSPIRRDEVITQLWNDFDLSNKLGQFPEEWWRLMNSEEIKLLDSNEFAEIGGHGYLHYNMGMVPREVTIKEMEKGKELLENTINHEIDSLAYPDGSYNEEVKDLAEKSHFQSQLATNYRCRRDNEDIRILPRYGLSATTNKHSNFIAVNRAFNTFGF